MKTTIALLIMLIPIFGIAQHKKDNVIIVPKTGFSIVKTILFREGYTLLNTDTVLLVTSEKVVPDNNAAIRFMIEMKDSTIEIKGNFKMPILNGMNLIYTGVPYDDVYYGGMKGSAIRNSWNEMDRIAKLISPNVVYIKK